MRRSFLTLTAASVLVLGGCRGGEVVVTATLEIPGAEGSQPLDDITVQLIPFDRDVVFDSLASAADTPEPELPTDLLEAQDSIAAAQERWQTMEDRWGTLRDSLDILNERMSQYSPAERTYRELYDLFNGLDTERARLEREKQVAFARFDSLSKANVEQSSEFAITRENWAMDAFADVDAIFTAREREAGREVQADTTGTPLNVGGQGIAGTARFVGLSPGTWWVHARYELPFTELYWNIPVEVVGGETTMVELTRENAVERPNF